LDKIRREKVLQGLPDWFKKVLAFIFQGKPPHVMLAPGLFTQLRARGVPVWFLGVNSEADLLTAVRLGATGVLTDRINWLTRTMRERKLAFKKIAQ
jgi:glycerophosphoryl diester phosphodiesterase